MPKTENVPIIIMVVRAHLNQRERLVRERLQKIDKKDDISFDNMPTESDMLENRNPSNNIGSVTNINNSNSKLSSAVNTQQEDDDFDLQKELEKKFDELFGTTDND